MEFISILLLCAIVKFYILLWKRLRDNTGEFKTDSQPNFHLYSNFSLQIIVAAHSVSAVLGTSGIPLSMTALKQQQHIQNHRLQKDSEI